MKVKLMSSNLAQPNTPVVISQNTMERIVSESEMTIGVAPVVIGAPPITYSYILVNRSAAAQTIRVGFAPGYGPNVGMLLNVNDTVVISSLATALSAVASAPGALLDRLVMAP